MLVNRADPDKLDPDNRANILIRTTREILIRTRFDPDFLFDPGSPELNAAVSKERPQPQQGVSNVSD